jgi:vacuolar-type H+-ATPase subunit H
VDANNDDVLKPYFTAVECSKADTTVSNASCITPIHDTNISDDDWVEAQDDSKPTMSQPQEITQEFIEDFCKENNEIIRKKNKKIICFYCKNVGHVAAFCKKKITKRIIDRLYKLKVRKYLISQWYVLKERKRLTMQFINDVPNDLELLTLLKTFNKSKFNYGDPRLTKAIEDKIYLCDEDVDYRYLKDPIKKTIKHAEKRGIINVDTKSSYNYQKEKNALCDAIKRNVKLINQAQKDVEQKYIKEYAKVKKMIKENNESIKPKYTKKEIKQKFQEVDNKVLQEKAESIFTVPHFLDTFILGATADIITDGKFSQQLINEKERQDKHVHVVHDYSYQCKFCGANNHMPQECPIRKEIQSGTISSKKVEQIRNKNKHDNTVYYKKNDSWYKEKKYYDGPVRQFHKRGAWKELQELRKKDEESLKPTYEGTYDEDRYYEGENI